RAGESAGLDGRGRGVGRGHGERQARERGRGRPKGAPGRPPGAPGAARGALVGPGVEAPPGSWSADVAPGPRRLPMSRSRSLAALLAVLVLTPGASRADLRLRHQGRPALE